MPNIFKHFLGPINSYTFPEADTIEIEDPPEDEPAENSSAAENEPEADSAEESENSAQALFSYAQVQADEIVAQARREGEELLEQLRQQAAQEADAAREAARQEGFRQGYADGMTKAQIEGKAALEKQLREQGESEK